jgi:antirestriction protein ArdC
MSGTKPNKVNQIITDKIIKELENNNLKWLKDWSLGFGCNYITRKEYKGVNALLINISLQQHNYKFNEWLTFNQLKSLKGTLNKGAKATQVIFFNIKEFCSCGEKNCIKFKGSYNGHDKKTYPILRYYNVFNIQDTDLKSKSSDKVVYPIEEVHEQINKYWDLTSLKLGNPAYSPVNDCVFMPKISNFNTKEGYYSALLHELSHSTGHKERLNRRGITENYSFGNEGYAYEELVAELSSAFLCGHFGIEKDINNSTAYIKGWLKKLKEDTTFIFKASAEAQKSQDFIKSQIDLKSSELIETVKNTVFLVRGEVA